MKKLLISLVCLVIASAASLQGADQIPTAHLMTTRLAGGSVNVATPSVFRILCLDINRAGTAFLHKSGKIITAAHVVEGADPAKIVIMNFQGSLFPFDSMEIDEDLDLALLTPKIKIEAPALDLTLKKNFSVGMQVSAWGYPAGYRGSRPLLVSGYLSGIESEKTSNGKDVLRWVINAAFNSGNSGGPLVDIETNEVIGVVRSKLAPIPQDVESALNALKNQEYGMMFEKTKNGITEKMSQAQVIEFVLQYLRGQTQLVIGYAVMVEDLKEFLTKKGIEP